MHNAFLREAKEFYLKVNKLKEETKKNYTARELSEILDIDYNKVVDFLSMHREIVSLDQQILDTSDETLGDYVEDKRFHIEDGIFQEELKENIAWLLESLTDKEREYVFMRFGFNEDNVPFDLAYICKKLKISRSRALLLEKKIIMKLGNAAKNNSKVKSLKIYLS